MAFSHSVSFSEESQLSQDISDDEGETDETLDPRVKGELDRLNTSTAEINRLEQALEEMHAVFRQTLTESAFVLKSHANRMGKLIKQSRPYYEALDRSKQVQMATQKAALKYERACSKHQAAKEMVGRAEQKLMSTSTEHKTLDPTWQDMLNKAVMKVMESEQEKRLCEKEHLEIAHAFTRAGKDVHDLKSKLKSAITKSKSYFDLKAKYMEILEAHKREIGILQSQLKAAKTNYSSSLRKLEGISDEIHEMRRSRESLDMCLLSTREAGVGAEAPSLPEPAYGDADDTWAQCGFSIAVITNTSTKHVGGDPLASREIAQDVADAKGASSMASHETTDHSLEIYEIANNGNENVSTKDVGDGLLESHEPDQEVINTSGVNSLAPHETIDHSLEIHEIATNGHENVSTKDVGDGLLESREADQEVMESGVSLASHETENSSLETQEIVMNVGADASSNDKPLVAEVITIDGNTNVLSVLPTYVTAVTTESRNSVDLEQTDISSVALSVCGNLCNSLETPDKSLGEVPDQETNTAVLPTHVTAMATELRNSVDPEKTDIYAVANALPVRGKPSYPDKTLNEVPDISANGTPGPIVSCTSLDTQEITIDNTTNTVPKHEFKEWCGPSDTEVTGTSVCAIVEDTSNEHGERTVPLGTIETV